MGRDDRAIIDQVLAGDRDAFGILIDRHRDGAMRLANRILRARADAEDVVQEALLHAFVDLAELRDRDRFVAWLLGIVVNLAKSRLRARREEPIEDWAGGRAPPPPAPPRPAPTKNRSRYRLRAGRRGQAECARPGVFCRAASGWLRS